MTTTSPSSQPTATDPVTPTASRQPRVGWFSLLFAAAGATIASFIIAMIGAGRIEAFFLAMTAPIVRQSSRSAMTVAVAAVVALVAATVVSFAAAGRVDSVTAQPGDIELTTVDFQFDTRSVTANEGTVAVTVANDDATRHTFTIDELGVDLNVPPAPPSGSRSPPTPAPTASTASPTRPAWPAN